MTKAELNKDVKRLFRKYKLYKNSTDYSINDTLKEELTRLYYADRSLNSLSKDNLLAMLKMNVSLRAIPFHQFGLFIDL